MPKLRLLPGEQEEVRLRPHPLSWLGKYFIAFLPALWGILLYFLYTSEGWQSAESGKWYQVWTFFYGNAGIGYVYSIAGLAVFGAILAVAGIRWRIFFGYLTVGILAMAGSLAIANGWRDDPEQYVIALPVMLVALSLPALVGAEWNRRSHHYVLTNLRILFRGGFFVQKERQLRYEAITDLDGTQGILGRIFNYGTLIPVTQSGFGLGNDTSEAHIGVGVGGQKMGAAAGIGVAAGGGKEVQVGRARTYNALTGVRPYRDVKYLMETLVQNATSTPYLQQQVDLQQQMLQAMQHMNQAQGHPSMPPAPPQGGHWGYPQQSPPVPPQPNQWQPDPEREPVFRGRRVR